MKSRLRAKAKGGTECLFNVKVLSISYTWLIINTIVSDLAYFYEVGLHQILKVKGPKGELSYKISVLESRPK